MDSVKAHEEEMAESYEPSGEDEEEDTTDDEKGEEEEEEEEKEKGEDEPEEEDEPLKEKPQSDRIKRIQDWVWDGSEHLLEHL